MGKKKTEETQKTTPKKGEPVEIPIPAKSQIMRDFEKVAAQTENGADTD
jgi:hypothetical protein